MLAQAGGDERALGQELGGADEALRLVGEVAVDLVADDQQARRVGDLADLADELRGGDVPVGLSGSVSTSTPGRAPMPAASRERGAQLRGVGHAAGLRADRHADHPLAGDRRVGGVAHPARERAARRRRAAPAAARKAAACCRARTRSGPRRSAARGARSSPPPPRARPPSRRPARSRCGPRPPRAARRPRAAPAARPRRTRGAAPARPPRAWPARARWPPASATAGTGVPMSSARDTGLE